jgi:hypothetical protein
MNPSKFLASPEGQLVLLLAVGALVAYVAFKLVQLIANARLAAEFARAYGHADVVGRPQYRLSRLSAQRTKKVLSVSISQTEGRMTHVARTLRIAYINNGRVQYSAWQNGDTATMKIK